jgi:hypothetical protein
MGMDMTEEAPMMEMTEEAMDMDMTAEAPMMEATDEMGMEMTEEAMMGPHCFYAELTGEAEVPGPGDEDGWGAAFVTLDGSTGEVCYDVAVANITLPAAAMHIHIGEADESGGVVVPFPTAPDANGVTMGCIMADVAVVSDIAANPEGYYVNVHTSDFPNGAVRGQLGHHEDMMGMMGDDMGMDMEMTPEATPAS